MLHVIWLLKFWIEIGIAGILSTYHLLKVPIETMEFCPNWMHDPDPIVVAVQAPDSPCQETR